MNKKQTAEVTDLPTPKVPEIDVTPKTQEQINGETFAEAYYELCEKHNLMIAPSLNVVPKDANTAK